MKQTTVRDYLAQASLLRLLAVLALVLLPHFPRLPPWAALLIIAVGAWRAVASFKMWPLPPAWIKIVLAVAVFAGIQASFGRLNTLSGGAALLAVMVSFKLLEMRERRDVMVTISLCYFLLLTQFLFSQEIWTIAYLLACTVVVTAMLIEASHPAAPLSPLVTLRRGGLMVAQALPLMLLFFVLFPRIPGPLWGLPADAGAARSGLSDTMEPGDIASLIQSDEIAFRVRFEGAAPPMRERYWRGPVLGAFNGRRWERLAYPPLSYNMKVQLEGEPIRYEVVLEPNRQHWLFALDLPRSDALPSDALLGHDFQLLARRPVAERRLYSAASHTRYRLEPEIPDAVQRIALRLPAQSSPRTRALTQAWRDEGLDGVALVDRALAMFRSQEFFYTLQPPGLGREPVDEFLFDTRRGFCEHYASSFTVLMRAAGVPARVVTGYQGGELNEVGGYYVVRQSDAHAWSEVWLQGQGWVRVDPTAAVAPSRIELGLGSALSLAEGLPSFLADRLASGGWSVWKFSLEQRWDWVNAQWHRWVLAYGPDLQRDFMANLGIVDWQQMIIVLTVGVTLLLALVGAVLVRQTRPVQAHDLALRLWRRASRKLARAGFAQAPAEGPRDFVARIAGVRPDLAPALGELRDLYLEARYLAGPSAEIELRLLRSVRSIKP